MSAKRLKQQEQLQSANKHTEGADKSRGGQSQAIIDAALRLFAKYGYNSTSMSGIAREAGLDQSSLYYWFANKEAILKGILEGNRSSLRFAARLGSFPGEKPLQLYAVLYADVVMLCEFPFDYYMLEEAAINQKQSFAEFFADYQTLFELVKGIIDAGIADGAFKPLDSSVVSLAALAFNEGIQHRYRQMQIIPNSPSLSRFDLAALAAARTLFELMPDANISALKAEALRRNWIVDSSKRSAAKKC